MRASFNERRKAYAGVCFYFKQVKKPFRKNGMNVGMASTRIGRKEVSFIYVDHTINSARGEDEEDVGWWPRAELWCDLHI